MFLCYSVFIKYDIDLYYNSIDYCVGGCVVGLSKDAMQGGLYA